MEELPEGPGAPLGDNVVCLNSTVPLGSYKPLFSLNLDLD